MNSLRIASIAALFLCAGCQTTIIRPLDAPTCEMPAKFQNACVETAKLGDAPVYGDLPDLAAAARSDFVECRAVYLKVVESYNVCISSLKKYNDGLKEAEAQARAK